MRSKRGAVNWTIGKLINIVLLTIVMALIIFGLTTGGLNPLIENIEGKFDEVLIMLNIKDDVSNEACFSADVASLGGGKVFLKGVNMEGENIIMNVCRDRMCNFTGGLSGYRVNEGVFEVLDGEDWKVGGDSFIGNMETVRFNRELYKGVFDILKDAEGVDFLKSSTKKFVLHGDGSGLFSYPITATWQDNVWIIKHGLKRDVFIEDDNKAIDKFVDKVWPGRGTLLTDDDIVTYNDDMGGGGVIGKLVGKEGWTGYDELDDEKEVERLKTAFAEKKVIYLDKIYPLDGAIFNLSEIISDHNSIIVDGITFDMEIGEIDGEVAIIFVSGELKFGLKYIAKGWLGNFINCERNFLQLILFKWDKEWKEIGNSDYYKLEEKCFKKIYRDTLTNDFLREKCR